MATAKMVGRERRVDDRHEVDVPVTIRAYRVSPIDGRLVDVSSGGALLALSSDAIGRGDEILVATLGLELVATIAWATDQFCGLAFHRKLHATELSTLRSLGRMPAAH